MAVIITDFLSNIQLLKNPADDVTALIENAMDFLDKAREDDD